MCGWGVREGGGLGLLLLFLWGRGGQKEDINEVMNMTAENPIKHMNYKQGAMGANDHYQDELVSYNLAEALKIFKAAS